MVLSKTKEKNTVYKAEIQIKKRKGSFQEKKEQQTTLCQKIAQEMKERVFGVSEHHSDCYKQPKKTTSLKNLILLKQYLTFVSNEMEDIILSDDKIQLSISDRSDVIEPMTNDQKTCRLGATLIEAYVHHDLQQEVVLIEDVDMGVGCVTTTTETTTTTPEEDKDENTDEDADSDVEYSGRTECICDSPKDDFGEMVQCDDCLRWLHVGCLGLDADSLKETFRCPFCVLSLGDASGKLSSSLSWRYAAQYKSQQLAEDIKSDEDDEDEDEDDWIEDLNSQSSYSQITTPTTRPIIPIALDQESLNMLSHIAYIDSVRKGLFTHNATDVFLYDTPLSNIPATILEEDEIEAPRFAANAPPSDMCTQDLSEYSFDSGPFWEPLCSM